MFTAVETQGKEREGTRCIICDSYFICDTFTFTYTHTCILTCRYAHTNTLKKPGECGRDPEAGVLSSCEPPHMGAGNSIRGFCKSSKGSEVLSHLSRPQCKEL